MASRKTWSWLGVVAALLLLPGLLWWDYSSRATQALRRHEKAFSSDLAAWRAVPTARVPVQDPPLEGNAWIHYRAALESFKKMPHEEQAFCPNVKGPPGPPLDPATFAPLWEKYRPRVEDQPRGVRARSVDPGWEITDGFGMLLPEITPSLTLLKFLRDCAVYHAGQGRDGEAVDVLLLGLAFSDDLGRRGALVCELVAIVGRSIMLNGLRELLASHALAASDLERAAGQLDRLQDRPPTFDPSIGTEDLIFRSAALKLADGSLGGVRDTLGMLGGLGGHAPSSIGTAVRYGFSHRAICAEALGHWEDYRGKILRTAALPPRDREKAMADAAKEATDGGNPLVAMVCPAYNGAWKNHETTMTLAMLARLAVAIAWYEVERGQPPPSLDALVPRHLRKLPVDPLTGGPFTLVAPAGGRIAVYSFGRDRDDDGGTPIPDEEYDKDGDIVWTIRRR